MQLKELKIFKSANSYLIISCLLVIFEIIYILKGQWYGDFFEHSAVVKELSKNLFHPHNPLLKSDIPHAFYSPYAVLVAFFSKITGFHSIHLLACFAVSNLIFFLYSFYYFSKSVFKKKHVAIASSALVLTMIFWGTPIVSYSGFYNIYTLHSVLPYPSTFAIALTLISLGLVSENSKKKYLIIILINTVVLITHPTTAVALFIGIVALSFSFNNYSLKTSFIKSFILIVPSIILSLFWPYFSMMDLFLGNNSNNIDFHDQSSYLYNYVLEQYWPILLVIPSFILSKKDSIIMFLIITIALLLLVFVGGYIFSLYGFSRVISYAMFFSHILIVCSAIFGIKNKTFTNKFYLLFLFSAIIISISLNFRSLVSLPIGLLKQKNIEYYNKFSFLENLAKPYDIILSDMNSSWYIPSFNGKVIASSHPLYWINDYQDRREDVNSFFAKESSDSLRRIVINKYRPDYLLINYKIVDFNNSTQHWLNTIGKTIYKKNELELIKIYEK